MNKIKTIIQKEWAEVFKNRMVLFTVAFMPLLMIAIPLGIIYATRGAAMGGTAVADMPSQMSATCPTNLSAADCF